MAEQKIYTPNPEYEYWHHIWMRNQDATDGADKIRSAGERYLPAPRGMKTQPDKTVLYHDYISRAYWYGATGRTVDGYIGLAFAKQPTSQIPESFLHYARDYTASGQDVEQIAKALLRQIIIKNRAGILVDYPKTETEYTQAEAEKNNLRPFAAVYPAETIIDWETARVNNVQKTVYVKLQENDYELAGDRRRPVSRLRCLKLETEIDGEPIPPQYTQYVYELTKSEDGKEQYVLAGTYTPRKANGQPFDYIPFWPVTQNGITWDMSYSMINDLAAANIKDYQTIADFANGLHVVGCPQPCVKGLMMDESQTDAAGQSTLSLGPHDLWQFEPEGEAWYMEFSGAGLDLHLKYSDQLRKDMAMLGARVLNSERKVSESTETAELHKSGEHGILSSAVNSLSEAIRQTIMTMIEWTATNDIDESEIQFSINNDFIPARMDSSQMVAYMQAVQSGYLSTRDIFTAFKRGGVIQPSKTYEDHIDEIAADGPTGMTGLTSTDADS